MVTKEQEKMEDGNHEASEHTKTPSRTYVCTYVPYRIPGNVVRTLILG